MDLSSLPQQLITIADPAYVYAYRVLPASVRDLTGTVVEHASRDEPHWAEMARTESDGASTNRVGTDGEGHHGGPRCSRAARAQAASPSWLVSGAYPADRIHGTKRPRAFSA